MVVANANNTFQLTNEITGTGELITAGPGRLLLTGDSSAFAGSVLVESGALIVGNAMGGSLGGQVTVSQNGLLGGIGTVGSVGSTVTITSGAVHAPGNSIGVQTIAGNYINHGTLLIEVTPTDADKVVVAGSVDITGATLQLELSPTNVGSWKPSNGPYIIIDKQSSGDVVGTFATPYQKNLLFLDALVAYDGGDGNDVTLQLIRNTRSFGSVGFTPNQIATGFGADTLSQSSVVWGSLAAAGMQDQAIVRSSLDALSGEVHASAKTALIEDSYFVRRAMNDRIRASFGAAGASLNPVLAYAPDGNPVQVAADHTGPAFWINGFGSWGSTNSDGNAAYLSRSTGGMLAGVDGLVGDWRLGALAGYSSSSFKVKDRASSGSSNNYHIGAYAGTQWGAFGLRAGAAYTLHDINTNRSVVIPGILEDLKAGYNGGTFQAFGELGYGIGIGNGLRLEPFANLAYVTLHTDGFTEALGAAALMGQSGSTNVTFTTLGLRGEYALVLGSMDAKLKGLIGWQHAFGDTTPKSVHAFLSGSSPFSISGVPIASNSAVIEAGLDLSLTSNITFGVSYAGQVADSAHTHGFTASLSSRF